MPREIWRPVSGWEGLYEVSSFGRVRSLDREIRCLNRWGREGRRRYVGRVLRLTRHCCGYPTVTLKERGRQEGRFVHSMVCEAFHGPRPEGFDAAHNDGNPANCMKENLRWATRSSNMLDRRRHGTNVAGENHPSAKLTRAQVNEIRSASGRSNSELGRQYGVTSSAVSAIRRGERWNVPE